MYYADSYRTIAELAISLAGFAGIAAVLKHGQIKEWDAVAKAQLFGLLYPTFCVALLAFAPELLEPSLGASLALRISQFAWVAAMCLGIATYFRKAPAREHSTTDRIVALALARGGGLLMLVQVGAVLGYLQSIAAELYLVSLLWLLFVAMVNFGMMIIGTHQDSI